MDDGVNVSHYAFSVGMIWVLFIGAAVVGFVCGLTVLVWILKLWIKVEPEFVGFDSSASPFSSCAGKRPIHPQVLPIYLFAGCFG